MAEWWEINLCGGLHGAEAGLQSVKRKVIGERAKTAHLTGVWV